MERLQPAIPVALFSGLVETPLGSEHADLVITKSTLQMGPGTESAIGMIKQIKVYTAIFAASLICGTWASAQNRRAAAAAGNAALAPTATNNAPLPNRNLTSSPPSSPEAMNWSTPDEPCAKYNDLKKYALGDIGVKIDVSDPAWAAAFRRALVFWNKILEVNFHEEKNIHACALRVTDGSLWMFEGGYTAFAQSADLNGFEAKIVVLPQVPCSPAARFVNAVHEIGHVVDLRHNPDPSSVMYPDIENLSEMREFSNAMEYGISHTLRHIFNPKSFMCPYVASVSKARLDKDDLAALSRNHLMRDGTVPPVKSDPSATLGMTKGEGRCKERAVAGPRRFSSPYSNRGHPRIFRNPTQYCTCRDSTANEPDSSDHVPLSVRLSK
jgi:hypothetical protein